MRILSTQSPQSPAASKKQGAAGRFGALLRASVARVPRFGRHRRAHDLAEVRAQATGPGSVAERRTRGLPVLPAPILVDILSDRAAGMTPRKIRALAVNQKRTFYNANFCNEVLKDNALWRNWQPLQRREDIASAPEALYLSYSKRQATWSNDVRQSIAHCYGLIEQDLLFEEMAWRAAALPREEVRIWAWKTRPVRQFDEQMAIAVALRHSRFANVGRIYQLFVCWPPEAQDIDCRHMIEAYLWQQLDAYPADQQVSDALRDFPLPGQYQNNAMSLHRPGFSYCRRV